MTYNEFMKILELLSNISYEEKQEIRDYLLALKGSEGTTELPSFLQEIN